MSHDAVISEISVNTDIQVQSSLLRKATLVDKIAIFGNVIFFYKNRTYSTITFCLGGNLGLFSGMSIIVWFEFLQAIAFSIFSMTIPKDSPNSQVTVFQNYLLAATLHGLQYLALMRYRYLTVAHFV